MTVPNKLVSLNPPKEFSILEEANSYIADLSACLSMREVLLRFEEDRHQLLQSKYKELSILVDYLISRVHPTLTREELVDLLQNNK